MSPGIRVAFDVHHGERANYSSTHDEVPHVDGYNQMQCGTALTDCGVV